MQTHPLGLRHVHRTAAARGRLAVSLTAVALSLLSLGCRRDPYMDAYFEMLNAEKRVLEDRLYETQYNYEQALTELEAERGNTKDDRKPASRKRAAGTERRSTEPTESTPPEGTGAPKEAPELPKIELPPGVEESKRRRANPPAMRPATTLTRESAAVTANRPPLSEEELAAAVVSALDQRVESINLNPRLTGGADFDGQPGDDGICVLVEPRNRSGDFVPEPARVSIVLLDPARTGEAARLARWELDADTARQFLQSDSLDRGLLLRLPWQAALPEGNRAHLFVRYVTADGRKIEADREIQIASPDRVAQTWTPRRSPLPENSASREVTVGWQPPAKADRPLVVQAVAELSAKPATGAESARPVSAAPQGRLWKPDR